jgi:hypothetical protein
VRTHLLLKGYIAAAPIRARRVIRLASGKVQEGANAHSAVIGISDNAAIQGGVVSVVMAGITEAVAGGSIGEGAHLTTGEGGVVVEASSNKAVIGIALSNAVAGDLVSVAISLSNH